MRLISKAKIKIDNSPLNSPLLNLHFAQRNIRRFPSVFFIILELIKFAFVLNTPKKHVWRGTSHSALGYL